jgi:hypothetical protein
MLLPVLFLTCPVVHRDIWRRLNSVDRHTLQASCSYSFIANAACFTLQIPSEVDPPLEEETLESTESEDVVTAEARTHVACMVES